MLLVQTHLFPQLLFSGRSGFFLPLQDPMPLFVLGWGMEGEVVSAKKGIVSLVAIAV